MNDTIEVKVYAVFGYLCANSPGSSSGMVMFEFVQNGLIFTSILAGIFCLGRVLFARSTSCNNSGLLFTVILTGLCHVLFCLYTLDILKGSLQTLYPRSGVSTCTDISFPATFSNAVVLAAIVNNVIRRNFRSSFTSRLMQTVIIVSMLIGFVVIIADYFIGDKTFSRMNYMTYHIRKDSKTELFWSVCKKKLEETESQLVSEYLFIYCPVILVVLAGWRRSVAQSDRAITSFLEIKILKDCSRTDGRPCYCSKMNSVFAAVLAYSFLLLVIFRPASVVYGVMTSGSYRDIFPGLNSTVLYCFLCGEYLFQGRSCAKQVPTANEEKKSTEGQAQLVEIV